MHSLRLFRLSPGFAAAAVAAIALGVAADTAIFSVVNTVLLKPFSFRDPERLVMLQNTFRRAPRSGSAAPREFNWWRRHADTLQDVSAYAFHTANLTGESSPELIPTMKVTSGFFRLCGAGAALGRTFTGAEDAPNAPRTAVLAYGFWQRHFAANPHIIGRRITLNGEPHEIIGVSSPALQNGGIAEQSLLSGEIELDEPPDVYLPFQIDPSSTDHGHGFNVAARLKPGITIAAANEQMRAGYEEYARQWTDLTPGAGFGVEPLQAAIVGGVRQSLWILLGAVGLVLLIACANVANLLLARATGRRREIAIRAALGASRSQIVRQLLTESAMLSAAGGGLGLASGYAGIRVLLALSPGIPRIGPGGANVSLDWRVLGFTLGLSLAAAILFGLVPALDSARADLTTALREGSPHFRRTGTRGLLVAAEMALAVILSIGAGLLIRSYLALRQVNPGFDAHNVLTMRMSITGPEFENPARVAQLIHESVRRIRALPGVAAAATTCCVPLDSRLQVGIRAAGRPAGVTGWTEVSAGYFETFRIPILRGRAFTERDEDGPPVAIVNQALARQFWPAGDPLNDQVRLGGDPIRVIGVAADVRDRGLNRDSRPTIYVPSATPGGLLRLIPWAWVIRTRSAPQSLSAAIQRELREASGGLPVGQVRTMEEILSRSHAREDFNTLVLTIFGCSSMLLAALGIYGSMAHAVAQRRREIGIRLALGAESVRIRNMVVLQGVRLALAGAMCGLAAAFALARLMAGFLFGVQARDPLVFTVAPGILLAVAVVAVWLPARRASRVDPQRALRCE